MKLSRLTISIASQYSYHKRNLNYKSRKIDQNQYCGRYLYDAQLIKTALINPILCTFCVQNLEALRYVQLLEGILFHKSFSFHVVNSYHFVHLLPSFFLDVLDLLANFDIVSFFTNVFVSESGAFVKASLFEDDFPLIAGDLTENCPSSTHCLFKNKFYNQVSGPLSFIIANIFIKSF